MAVITYADITDLAYDAQVTAVWTTISTRDMSERIAKLADYDRYDQLASVSGADMDPDTMKAWAAFGTALAKQTGRKVTARKDYGGTSWQAEKSRADLERTVATRELDRLRREHSEAQKLAEEARQANLDENGVPWADRCTAEDPCPARAEHGALTCGHG